MKKLLLIVAAFICSINVCNAQNYEVLYVEQLVSDSVYRYCQPQVSGVIIYGQEGCEFNQFYVDGQLFENYHFGLNSQVQTSSIHSRVR